MKRLIWIGIGVGLTVVVMRRGRRTAERFVPATLLEQGQQIATDTVQAVGSFMWDVREAMAQREAELRQAFADTEGSDAATALGTTKASRAT